MAEQDKRIKLVAVDLDGTLLDDSKKVTQQTVNALKCLTDVKVVIASARPPRSVRHIYHQLGLDTLQINYNGALIWSEVEQRTVFHQPIGPRLGWEIIDFARDLYEEILVSCEIQDRWFTDRDDHTYTTETGKLFKPDLVAPLEKWAHQAITKLMLLGEPAIVLKLEDAISRRFQDRVSVIRTDKDLIQIMDNRVSKATSLQRVASFYGIEMSEVMAIGDAPNDVAMLQVAGIAIAMDNAHRLVKDHADWIAPSNNDHGVHAALVKYGVCPA